MVGQERDDAIEIGLQLTRVVVAILAEERQQAAAFAGGEDACQLTHVQT